MTRKLLVLTMLLFGIFSIGFSQNSNLKISAKPADMWEAGIHVGHTALTGDVDWGSDFGIGVHLRKAIDYAFSVRLDVGYYRMSGEEDEDSRPADAARWGFAPTWKPMYESSAISGDLTFQANLNQFKTGKKNKINPYMLAGAGAAIVSVTAMDGNREVDVVDWGWDDEFKTSPYLKGGLGIGFLVGAKMSVSIEHTFTSFLGRGSDLMDAAELRGSGESGSRDLLNYTSVRLGFGLGKLEDKSLPLWWASPLDMLADDLAEVKARPKLDLTDTDGDGIIDMLDQEKDTPSGAAVDTKGVALDSDGDGVSDYQDKEPYSPPGYNVDDQGVANVPTPNYVTEDDVNRIVDAKIKDINVTPPARPVEWFLPMINFANNSYRVRSSEFGKLHNVATSMKQNPGIRVVVTGHTDKTSGNCYNDKLSFNRAQAAVDYVSNKYGIAKERFIINWKGENENLVPTNGGSLMNRRVEFTVATTETAQAAPDCGGGSAGVGGTNYSGNKEAGY